MSSNHAENVRLLADGEEFAQGDPRSASSAPADPHLGAQIAFQQELRKRVADALMSEAPTSPAGLADRIHDAIAADSGAASAGATDHSPIATIGGAQSRSGSRISIFAVAASLALVAGAVLFGIFGPRIDRVAPYASSNQPADLNTQAAVFANEEHDRFVSAKDLPVDLLCWKSADEAQTQIANWLGRPSFTIADLSDLGYEFKGACQSEFPGSLRAARMIYGRTQAAHHRRAFFSVFIVPDNGQFDQDVINRMEPGKTYSLKPHPRCKLSVQRCTDSQLIYFMICCDQRDLPSLANRVASCVVPPSGDESSESTITP
ncbi:MAG TPA: hypothetical protein VG711_11490 [Phycisphaerales bacterium]|nr:hypothetical protein [Phycisphaerales bacterium]